VASSGGIKEASAELRRFYLSAQLIPGATSLRVPPSRADGRASVTTMRDAALLCGMRGYKRTLAFIRRKLSCTQALIVTIKSFEVGGWRDRRSEQPDSLSVPSFGNSISKLD
jgi:hypothetical protein